MEAVSVSFGLRVVLQVVDIATNKPVIDTSGVWHDVNSAAPEWMNYGAIILGKLGTAIDLPVISRPIKRSRWSGDDDKLLMDYYKQNLTISEIAANLGRTEQAIVKRRWRLTQKKGA